MNYPIFLSVVLVIRNRAHELESLIAETTQHIAPLASDYELVIVDNASTDDSVPTLKRLSGEKGFANLQVYALTKQVDQDTAFWVGIENSLGDFVAALDPLNDSTSFLPEMLAKSVDGADVVFATNKNQTRQGFLYRLAYGVFNIAYKKFSGIHLAQDAPQYRILSKRVVNFILRHRQPALSYRYLSASGGFTRANLAYNTPPKDTASKSLLAGIDRGLQLLLSTTRAPMRLVTLISIFGAFSNLLYSFYVVGIGLFKADVAPGWTSLSLQQSGMFFLFSLAIALLSEYVLQISALSNDAPNYHVAQEFTSAQMTRLKKLNIETVNDTVLSRET